VGGYQSGFKGIRKLTTAEVLNLDVNRIGIKRTQRFSGNIAWENGSEIRIAKSESDSLELSYVITDKSSKRNYTYEVKLDYTSCHYSNERPWFLCPHCGKRVGKLYHRDGYFRCRSCHRLNYRIQQEDIRDRVIRSIDNKIHRIQDKLKTERGLDNIFDIPKPRYMHLKTYNKLLDQLKELYIERDKSFMSILDSYKTKELEELRDIRELIVQ
jgi:DNA-directed RNA polymerase subunit RPC12/RpoP